MWQYCGNKSVADDLISGKEKHGVCRVLIIPHLFFRTILFSLLHFLLKTLTNIFEKLRIEFLRLCLIQ